MHGLEGKVILVTGATGNLGGAVAKSALTAGAKVALAGRSMTSLERSFADGDNVALIPDVDLTDAESARRYIDQAGARGGRIEVS